MKVIKEVFKPTLCINFSSELGKNKTIIQPAKGIKIIGKRVDVFVKLSTKDTYKSKILSRIVSKNIRVKEFLRKILLFSALGERTTFLRIKG